MLSDEALSIATLAKEVLPFLTLLGVGLLLWFSWVRAGSAHFLRERIWALLGGSKDFHDAYLNDQWKKVRDLETARYRTGIRFQSRSSAADTFAWLNEHDVPLDDLLKSARYFDPSGIQMQNPNLRAKAIVVTAAAILLLLMALGTAAFAVSGYALLTVKKTGSTFWIDGQNAYAWDRAWGIDLESCTANAAPIDNEHDKSVICDLLKPDASPFVEKSLSAQRYVGSAFMIFLIGVLVVCFRSFGQARVAREVHLKTTRNEPAQLDLNLR